MEFDEHFASSGIKLYYVKVAISVFRGTAQFRVHKENVLIETLQAGRLGLPSVPEPKYFVEQESGQTIPILHPSVLILTKMKRWAHSCESTFPKTVLKNASDQADLEFMIVWLAANDMQIEFELYQGKTKEQLLDIVRVFRNRFIGNTELMADLESIMKPADWELLIVGT
ncbi:hypothetical protein CPC08DRAFT_637319 [Agrocybe pediades]|nr:hypothetical protein CPC08DRAFT_637319 [Agrocybe pediades]